MAGKTFYLKMFDYVPTYLPTYLSFNVQNPQGRLGRLYVVWLYGSTPYWPVVSFFITQI